MKKGFVLLSMLLLPVGCVEKKKQQTEENQSVESAADTIPVKKMEPIAVAPDGSYFKATGTEPFWGLKLYDNRIELQMMEDTIMTPPTEPIAAQDSNIKMYRVKTEATSMDIIIAQKECTNAMSGAVSPYTVTIVYKSTGEDESHALEGCGAYITDYRLHDIWVLEQMGGTIVTKDQFGGRDVPNMEININDNRFSGFSGCNRMMGSLFYEQDVLRFTQVAGTKMACPSLDKESEFLQYLQASTTYAIANNRLTLSNDSQDNLLVFKKIN